MNRTRRIKLSRSLRKHLRRRKAALRRELPPAQARLAIDKLKRLHRD